jgi:hypothetical protein
MRALSIVTVPLLAAVFVLLNFAVGYLSRGVITSARTVTVALASSGASRADCLTRQGVFPAGSMLADVSTDARGLVTPLHDPKGMRQEQAFAAVNEERFTLERHPLRMWEMFYFQAESTRPLGGTVRLADLGGGRFEVTNASAVARRACFVAAGPGGGDFAWVGDLPPNASRQGTLVRWSQKPDFAHNPGTPGAPLSLRDALELWMHDGLGQATSYAPPREESGFAAQAAMVISGDPRLEPARLAHGSRMLLFARAGEELEPLRLDGRRLGGQSADVLVVCAEPGPRP